MKAAMLVAGGFSGGLSSTIAGGKFIAGFKQGLITSGLNHLAHLGATAIEIGKIKGQIRDRIIEKCGEDYLNQPVTEQTLQDFASIFSEMFGGSAKDYQFANESNVWADLSIEDGKLYDGVSKVKGVTHMFKGNVLFSPDFIGSKGVLAFAGTWYHETIHSIHAVSGFFTKTLNQFMNNGYDYNSAVRSAINVSETIAHFQTRTFGIGITFNTPDFKLRNYGQSYIEFLNLK